MIRVITVEREYGSQGAEFAHRLAGRLNWKLIDRCLIDEIAHKAGVSKSIAEQCDERLDPWYHRMELRLVGCAPRNNPCCFRCRPLV